MQQILEPQDLKSPAYFYIFTPNLLERTTEIEPPIGHPSTCLINVPSTEKVQHLHNSFNNFLKTDS